MMSEGISIFIIAGTIALSTAFVILIWVGLWRRGRAGSIILKLGRAYKLQPGIGLKVGLIFPVVLFLLGFVYLSGLMGQTLPSGFFFMTMGIYYLLVITVNVEIREKGIAGWLTVLKWQNISLEWAKPGTLIIWRKLGMIKLSIPEEKQIVLGKVFVNMKPDDPLAHYGMARLYALRNEKIKAIDALKRAISLNSRYLFKAKTDDNFTGISDSEEFQELVNR